MQKHPQQESIDMIRKIIHIDEEKMQRLRLVRNRLP